ncbi:MAG: Ldh family oxidoreductase [Bradyrhizobiaceae bacterium]|nr:Ldh family oxidoreductase [Bradyrhizobiaceae bacterium]
MDDTRISESDLLGLATRCLVAGGMRLEDAADAARVLVLADMFGLGTHGISRIPQYLERVHLGGIDARADVTVERVSAGVARVDGANGIGPVVGMRALAAARDGAQACGIGAAFARGSNHFGPVMPYGFLAAQDGFVSIIASNATTTIAPWGGRGARLGNNPLGIGVPHPGGDPILLDIAMSVVARAKIRNLAKAGASMPADWAAGPDGKPTTDPRVGLAGFLLPMGGHKGYGLAVMVDLLAGLLSGAAYLTHVQAWDKNPGTAQDLGHVFILIDTKISGFAPWLAERMQDFRDIVASTPAADPSVPVMAPGDRELKSYASARNNGVAVAAGDLAALRNLAGEP